MSHVAITKIDVVINGDYINFIRAFAWIYVICGSGSCARCRRVTAGARAPLFNSLDGGNIDICSSDCIKRLVSDEFRNGRFDVRVYFNLPFAKIQNFRQCFYTQFF